MNQAQYADRIYQHYILVAMERLGITDPIVYAKLSQGLIEEAIKKAVEPLELRIRDLEERLCHLEGEKK
jgi:hypothetical protein